MATPKPKNSLQLQTSDRSEIVEEIIGKPPHWIVKFGYLLIIVVLVVLIGFVSLYRYPDIVEGELELTSVNPPYPQFSPSTFKVAQVTVDNLDTVEAGQVLIAFESTAQFGHILSLEDRLTNTPMDTDSALASIDIPSSLDLGTLQAEVYDFQEAQEAYRTAQYSSLSGLSVRQLNNRISQELAAIQRERRQQNRLENELEAARKNAEDDQVLFKKEQISRAEYQASLDNVLRIKRLIRSIETNVRNHRFEVEIMRNQIFSLQTGEENQILLSGNELRERYNLLLTSLESWKKKFLLLTPIDGVVHFDLEIRENQLVNQNDPIATVVPLQGDGIIGRINLDLTVKGSGKVRVGQRVLVKFTSYPFLEFGAVEAVISRMAEIPSGGKIQIQVSFPNGLLTNTGRTLSAKQFMKGQAEIITEEKSLLSWFMDRY
ncbi:MAG: HlyD family efflux transporter periplasmic adaptor subunit [Bacteroidota bacterium]